MFFAVTAIKGSLCGTDFIARLLLGANFIFAAPQEDWNFCSGRNSSLQGSRLVYAISWHEPLLSFHSFNQVYTAQYVAHMCC